MGSAADDPGASSGPALERPAHAEPALDIGYLRRFTHGDAALEREVLHLFATQLSVSLEQLRASATAKAWREWSHAIKGSAAAVGANQLAAAALAAEQLDFAAEDARSAALAALDAAAEEVCGLIASSGDGPATSDPLVFARNAG